MIKEKKILLYFVSFVLGLLTIMFIGISDVFALTNKTIYSGVNSSGLTGSGYYNYGYINAGGVQNTTTAQVGSTINGISYGFQFYYYEDIILNNTYTLRINFKDNDLLKNVNSSFFEIQTCTTNNCSNAIIISLEKSSKTGQSNWVILKFNPVDIGDIVSVNIGSDDNQPITGIENFGISSIQTEYTNENQDIIDNNNNNTNNIIDNNNNNTQNIIDSVEGTIKDTFEDCRPSINLFNINSITSGYYYNADLIYSSAVNTALSDYINVSGKTNVTLSFNSNANSIIRFNYFNSNKEIISQDVYTTISGKNSKTFTIPNNVSYVRFSYNTSGVSGNTIQLEYGSVANNYEEFGKEICQNKIDETNDKLDNLNGSITNDNIDDNNISNAFNEFENFVDENATISTLLTLPVTLFSAILNGLQNSCTPFNLGSLYGEDLILPCIDISSYLGNTLWTMIDVIISGFAIYFISQKFIKVFNSFSSMKEGDVIDD